MTERLLAHILPSNATDYERLLASQVQQIMSLDASEIRRLWNPQTCDAALLPYLAWALSVDIWFSDWSDARKRQAVAQSFNMHRMKGTKAGIAAYLGLVDAKLISAVQPPAKTFATGGFANQQSRLDWLAGLPQIRIYPFLTGRIAPKFRSFFSRPGGFYRRSFYNSTNSTQPCFMPSSDGINLMGRKAFYVDGGVSTPASYEVLPSTVDNVYPERIAITTSTKAYHYGSAFFGRSYMQTTDGSQNVIKVNLQTTSLGVPQFSLPPGSRVTDLTPLRVAQGRTAPSSVGFLGAANRQKFMSTSYGPNMVYDQITILDPTRPLLDVRKGTKFFYGHCRFGIAPFTAELSVEVPMTRPKWRAGRFYTGFMQKADMQPVENVLTAIDVSKSLRDTILVDTVIYRPVTLSDAPMLGTFTLGEVIKVR